jgi:hypothetical protein
MDSLNNPEEWGFLGTIEFFPEEGKYHFDGHRACGKRMSPEETISSNGCCPQCGRKVTIGVMHRVTELADRPPRPDAQRDLFESRVAHWSGVMGVSPRRVFLKNQRTLWGSCSTRGNLNFNRALAEAPPEVVDYVVIHELAHLAVPDHSKAFWDIVNRYKLAERARGYLIAAGSEEEQ